MKIFTVVLFIFNFLFISACSTDDSAVIQASETEEIEDDDESRNPAERAIFSDPLIRAHKKSQGVQDIIDDADVKRKQDLQDAGF